MYRPTNKTSVAVPPCEPFQVCSDWVASAVAGQGTETAHSHDEKPSNDFAFCPTRLPPQIHPFYGSWR